MSALYTHTHVVLCGGKPLIALQTTGDAGVGRLITRLKLHADATYGTKSPVIYADSSSEMTAQTEDLPSVGLANEKAALEQAIAILDTHMAS